MEHDWKEGATTTLSRDDEEAVPSLFNLWRDEEAIVERRTGNCLAPFLESSLAELSHEGANIAMSKDEQDDAPFPFTF